MPPRTPTALIVEDDDAARAALVELLSAHGWEPAQAADGAEALEVLGRAGPPAVILLDWLMPRLCGEAFLTRRAACPVLSAVPVVVMSATHTLASDRRVQGFLAKPFSLDELLGALRAACAAAPAAGLTSRREG